jgi:hypothetical protein
MDGWTFKSGKYEAWIFLALVALVKPARRNDREGQLTPEAVEKRVRGGWAARCVFQGMRGKTR